MTTNKDISNAAAALGRKGGSVKSQAKTETARENGAKGGRPALVTYQHPDKRILIGYLGNRAFAGFRFADTGNLECVCLDADAAKIEEISEAWYDDEAPMSRMQKSGRMMQWIDAQMIPGDAAPSFVAAARQYCG